MAGGKWKAQTGVIQSGTTPHTVLQIVAPAQQGLKISEWSISFQGTTNTASPVEVSVLRQTNAGVMGTATSTITKDGSDWPEVIQTTIQDGGTGYSTEPTAGAILYTELIHPQQGFCYQHPWGAETKVAGGGRLGIRITAAANVPLVARFIGEE